MTGQAPEQWLQMHLPVHVFSCPYFWHQGAVCAVQVAAAVADAVGPELTGIRLSPFSSFNEATDPETLDLNLYLVEKLSGMNIVYAHAVEPRFVA